MLNVYYNIDGGITKFCQVTIDNGTTIYHHEVEGCIKQAIISALYNLLSDGGKKDVGKITVIHASIA